MDIATLAAAKTYTYQTIMGAGAVKGEKGDKGDPGEPGIPGVDGAPGMNGSDGKDGVDGKDGLSIKAISIKQDNTGKIIDATATLSDDTTLKVDIITVDSGESDGGSGDDNSNTETSEEDGFDSVEF